MGRFVRLVLLSVLVLAAAGTASASAAPFWKFDGHLLIGSEKVRAKAIDERFTIPGATTECTHATLEMEITGLVTVKGSAGGLIENSTETITFDKASESATGTVLKVGTVAVEWDAVFATEALGAHKGEHLEG